MWILFAVLMLMWLLGMVTFHTAGGLLHLLLVVALIVLIIKAFSRL